MNIYIDPIVRTAILSEVAVVRHERELARVAAATAMTNDRGGYWRHRADAYNRTLRSLFRVLGDIREGTARQEAEELDAARVEARLDPEPHYEDWTVGELVEAFGK